MYKTEQKEVSSEGETITVWGISDENGFIFDFTTDYEAAKKFVALLNENNVGKQHVAEIAEDFFYT